MPFDFAPPSALLFTPSGRRGLLLLAAHHLDRIHVKAYIACSLGQWGRLTLLPVVPFLFTPDLNFALCLRPSDLFPSDFTTSASPAHPTLLDLA